MKIRYSILFDTVKRVRDLGFQSIRDTIFSGLMMVMMKMLMVIKLIMMVMVAAYHLHFAELEPVVHLGLALPLNGSAKVG